LVFLLFIPSAINNNTKNIYTPFGADLTIQVSVKPNIILDKIIQTPIKPIHNFYGLFFIIWRKNLSGNTNTIIGSASERFIFWTASINTVKKYPFFGSGSGDFRLELRRFTKEYPQYNVIADHY
jgi:hypothetical protein